MKRVLEQPEFALQYVAAIVESSSDAIIGTDLDGIVATWNRGAEELYGYRRDEVVGTQVGFLIPPERMDESRANAERIRRGERIEPFETVRLRRNGSLLEVSIAMSPIADTDGQIIGLASVTRNISEQRRTMAALQEHIAFEQLIIRISAEFINLDPAETDSCITSALAEIGAFADVDRSYVFRFCDDWTRVDNTHEWCAPGIEPQAHRLQNAPLAALPELAAGILRGEVTHVPSTRALAQYAPVDAEELRTQDIQALLLAPMISRGVPIGFLGFDSVRSERTWSDDMIRLLTMVGQVFVNALERKWAAETLRERELQYRSIFETTSDGLVVVAVRNGRVVDANPAMCRMHGYEPGEMTGMRRKDFIHPDYHDVIADYVRAARPGDTYRIKAVDVRKDGSPLHVEVHATPISFGGEDAILGVVRDVTSDVQAFELLEQRVAERTRELSLLVDMTRNVASTLELQPLLELILDQLKSVVDYTGTAVLTIEGDDMVIVGHRSPLALDIVPHIRHRVSSIEPVWDRLVRGEAIVFHDVRADTPEARVFRGALGDGLDDRFAFIGSCMWAPLTVKDQLIGIMSIANREPNAFTPRQAEMAAAIARQAAVAIENARLFQQAQGKAALEERQKLARELHDSVSQALYGIALGAQTIRRMLEIDPEKAVDPTDYVLSLAEAGMAEMRALIFELRPESLETEGLVEALRKQTAALRARYGIEIVTDFPDEPDVPLEVKEALYRIAQESLHNTVKHARATQATLTVASHSGEVVLEVSDNGRGFDPSGSFPGHLGLQSMRERVSRLRGHVEIDSTPGDGARVRATIPIVASPVALASM